MGDETADDRAAVRIFPPGVPLVTVLTGVAANRLLPIDPGFALPGGLHWWIGGLVIAAAIVLLGAWPVAIMRRGGQSENPWTPTTGIVLHGPYRLTRNPMYLQMVIVCIGFAVLLWNPWILILTPLCAWVLQRYAIRPEEAYLERKFGDVYLAYKRRVRRWI